MLHSRPGSTAEMAEIFSDAATIGHALDFEITLARAEADEGLISSSAATVIAEVARALAIDPAALAEDAAHAGTLAIPLVQAIRDSLPADTAASLHLGATSQDLADTVMVLQIKAGAHILDRDATRLCAALCGYAGRYAAMPAIGRTLLQDARPIGFGLRLAQAAAAIDDARRRLVREVLAGAILQFGGAVGTRAGLGGKGRAIAAHMADALGLAAGPPWHGRRTASAAIAGGVGILVGAVGKLARDIALLSQDNIGEVREPAIAGRGGSSAMPHKRNPTGCQVALSAAVRAPGLVGSILAGMPQEAERGLGGWQAEAPVIADLFQLAAASLTAMAPVVEGLEIHTDMIARNLQAAGQGADIGESEAIVASLIAHIERK